jgi:hypothetical protein
LETWDPHPGPAIGGPTKAIDTKLPGLEVAHLFPRMAEEIHHLSVIRSLVSKEGDHERGTYMLKTGFRPDPTLKHPSLGAILTREQPDTAVEIPQHVSLGGSAWPARGGFLGDQYDAFKIFDPGRNLHNMKAACRRSPKTAARASPSSAASSSTDVATDRTDSAPAHRGTRPADDVVKTVGSLRY